MSDGASADATVIIIVKDEPSVELTLDRLRPQCTEAGVPCIVVDASEESLQPIANRHPWARWVPYHQPAGRRFTIPHQRNVGVRAATTSRVVFCDAGILPDGDWLARMLEYLDTDPSACWCGPIVSLDSPPLRTLSDAPDKSRLALACTANMGFSREAFDAIGGFDEGLNHGEDIDFGWRAEDAGYPVLCAAAAVVRVAWGDTRRQIQRAFRYGRCTPELLARNPRRIAPWLRMLPDTIAYPAWLLGWVVVLPASLKFRWAPWAWLALLGIPLAKNADERPAWRFLLLKVVRAWGFLSTIARVVPLAASTTSHGLRRDVPPTNQDRSAYRH